MTDIVLDIRKKFMVSFILGNMVLYRGLRKEMNIFSKSKPDNCYKRSILELRQNEHMLSGLYLIKKFFKLYCNGIDKHL